jgi:hypothetical protein
MCNIIALLIAAILSSLQMGMASNLGEGFYALSLEGSGFPVKINDHTFYIGNRLNFSVVKAEVRSENNANTKFQLTVTMPNDQKPQSNIALFVGGTAYSSSGGGGDQKTVSLEFPIAGRDSANQVANLFKIKPILRSHPHYELEIFIKPTREEFFVGQRVSVLFHLRNVGGTIISFKKGGRNRAARDNQYVFSCRLSAAQVEDIGNSAHFGGISTDWKLKPGEVFEEEIDLSKWFAFDKPGIYELLGSYYMEFKDPDEDIPSFSPIWTDYATSEFIVKIK